MTATPRPWFIDSKNFDMGNDDEKAFCSIRGMSKEDQTTPWHIAEVLASGPNPNQDAALIVQAVNTHDINKKARLTLEGLTPGGSEYVNDPERCAAYVQRIKHDAIEAHKQVVRLKRTHDRAKAELADVFRCYERDNVDERRNNTGVNIHLTHKSAERIEALLAEMEGSV